MRYQTFALPTKAINQPVLVARLFCAVRPLALSAILAFLSFAAMSSAAGAQEPPAGATSPADAAGSRATEGSASNGPSGSLLAPPSDAPAGAVAPAGQGDIVDDTSPPGDPRENLGRSRSLVTSGPIALLVADSEFVYGPTLYGFDVEAFVSESGGYLARYNEFVDGEALTGAQVVLRVSGEYSVGPRLLLSLIEMHSGWVLNAEPTERNFPVDEPMPGLYPSLSAAADRLNAYYYAWRYDGRQDLTLAGGVTVRVNAPNAGTYGIVGYLSQGTTAEQFASMVDASRFYAAWTSLFGDAHLYAAVPTVPQSYPQLDMQLPFGAGEMWFYVSGPRSPQGAFGPRAAVDFAPPPPDQLGCAPAPSLVRAVARGRVLQSSSAGVVVDTDDDEFLGSGWVHVYGHLTSIGRVESGERVGPGDPMGTASCEGGAANLARTAISRRFNGEWIPADHDGAPMILGGWAPLAGAEPGTGWLIHGQMAPREAAPVKDPGKNGVAALTGSGP